jgi:hypothetical protein
VPTCGRNAPAAALNLGESPISLTPRLLCKPSTQIQLGGAGPTAVSRAFPAPALHARERQRRPDLFIFFRPTTMHHRPVPKCAATTLGVSTTQALTTPVRTPCACAS